MAIKPGATPQAREAARRACAALADARAAALAPVIAEIRASGITAPYAIAAALTARRIPTARGHRLWGAQTVSGLLNRLDRLAADGVLGSRAVAIAAVAASVAVSTSATVTALGNAALAAGIAPPDKTATLSAAR
jgi:hypothetical protein